MLKRTLLTTVMVGMLMISSGCCGGLRNWLQCGHAGGTPYGGCGSEACAPGRLGLWRGTLGMRACDSCEGPVTRGRCGSGLGCGTELFDLFGWGCGEMYWGDHIAVPPDYCEPCDKYGNWTGPGPVQHGPVMHYPHEGEIIYGPEMPMEVYEEVVPHHAARSPAKQPSQPTPAKPLASRPRVAY